MGGFGVVVVDDEGLWPHEERIRVRRAVAEGDRQREFSAFIAEVTDETSGKREVWGVVNARGEFSLQGGEDIGRLAKAVAVGPAQGTSGVTEDGIAAAWIGRIEEEGIVAVGSQIPESTLAVECAENFSVQQAETAEEITHECMPVLRKYRFWVELHAPVRKLIHLEGLNYPVFTAGMDCDSGDLIDVEGVIAHDFYILRDAGENSLSRVAQSGDMTMAWLRSAGHRGTSEHG